MAYFTNPKINPNRAVLIFSTHYADLIDDLSRGDQIFVSRRQDSEIAIDRYSDIADRQDINRAEIFMSNYLGAPPPTTTLTWNFFSSFNPKIINPSLP